MIRLPLIIPFLILLVACSDDTEPTNPQAPIQLLSARVGDINVLADEESAPVDDPIVLTFSEPITFDPTQLQIQVDQTDLSYEFAYLDDQKSVSLQPTNSLNFGSSITLYIQQLSGRDEGTFGGDTLTFQTENKALNLLTITFDQQLVEPNQPIRNISWNPVINLQFDAQLSSDLDQNFALVGPGSHSLNLSLSSDNQSVEISPGSSLDAFSRYILVVKPTDLSADGFTFSEVQLEFTTKLDSTLKFPEISDEELLTKIQEQTFKYFWDFGHPVSGLARERNTSGETVTTGGSGFGLMSIIVGIERGFISREAGIERLETIVDFLTSNAERYHGVWAHWLNGTSGTTIPFSENDDGGDLVETAFLTQGLLTVRQYLDMSDQEESVLIDKINVLWEAIEWDWYTQGGQDVLYWHWSPRVEWAMNLPIRGWNEALIIYVLAAGSPTHPIDKSVYESGWARDGGMVNSGSEFYGYSLPLRNDQGGPLFFAHYSFLGLDPRNLSDQYANYWEQNRTHTLINRAYCVENPRDYLGYSDYSWGLTASDGNQGYSAHSPGNDRGVITPTAAVSSIPYTPEESLEAIRHFYYILGDKLWGEYGFYDAFNATEGWYADSYIAIDQGPIIVMIENYRTGLLWELFMSAPEVKQGLDKLGFTY